MIRANKALALMEKNYGLVVKRGTLVKWEGPEREWDSGSPAWG